MIADLDRGRTWAKSPKDLGGANTQALAVFVDDVDAHCAHARTAGATIAMEPQTRDHGEGYWIDRSYEAIDLEGHHWWFIQRMSRPEVPGRSPEERSLGFKRSR